MIDNGMVSEFITIHFTDVTPFIKAQDPVRLLLRHLHEQGIEGELGTDETGPFIRYYRPEEDFEEFCIKLYHFITEGGNEE